MPDETERMSLRQCVKILGGHELCLLCPQELDVSAYMEQTGKRIRVERFDGKYFLGIEGYNDLLKSKSFYLRFKDYDYLLIYQLDAWVFRDELDEWCQKGYDYIGAPWFKDWFTHEEGYDFFCVGNGGLSLRKVSRFLKVTNPSQRLYGIRQLLHFQQKEKGEYKRKLREFFFGSNRLGAFMKQKKERWEDVFFCYELKGTRLELRVPDCKEAALFSIETSPAYIFNEVNNGRLPFGCHAWRKYQYEHFWKKHINMSNLEDETEHCYNNIQ